MREDNKLAGSTTVFTYDQNGNITERCEYPYTLKSGEELEELKCTHYSYDYEGDKLKEYNGEAFVYNNLGCPTTYRGKPATWIYGKLLASYNGVQFTYNGLGSRASKGGITFTYDSDGRLIKQSNGLEFIYDNSGVAGVIYANETYFYRKDAQGNIVAILTDGGAVVVKYVYDAWGNNIALNANGAEITSGIGVLNPFRYRGYYYDTETELYYLQTRYYDPELGRFISQDSLDYADPETINGLNLYAYCLNNPVKNIDPTGENVANDLQSIKTYILLILKSSIGFITGLSKTTQGLGRNSKAIASIFGNFSKGISKVFTAINYGLIALSNIIDGIDKGKTALNIITDIAFDWTAVALGVEIGAAIGALVGSFFPGAGNVVGGIVGAILGGGYMLLSSSSFIKQLKDAFYNGVKTIFNDIGNFFVNVGNSISSWFRKIFRW